MLVRARVRVEQVERQGEERQGQRQEERVQGQRRGGQVQEPPGSRPAWSAFAQSQRVPAPTSSSSSSSSFLVLLP